MKNIRYVYVGIFCLLLAVMMCSVSGSAVSVRSNSDYEAVPVEVQAHDTEYEAVPVEVREAQALAQELNVSYQDAQGLISEGDSGVQVLTSYLNNPIHPALRYSDNIIYNDVDFYLYSSEPTDYKISVYIQPDEPAFEVEGKIDFTRLVNYQVPDGVKKLRKVVVIIGDEKTEWDNVKVMHKAIDETKVYTSPEEDITTRQLWLFRIQAFAGGVVASCVFGWLFWKWWKKHLENQIQEVM